MHTGLVPPPESSLLHRGGPAGTWGSLGLWTNDRHYADACRALAVRVGTAAAIGPGDRVLGLACGAGDDLCLWVEHFAARHATGIEIDARLAARASARCEALAPARFTVLARSALAARDLPEHSYDRVVCVDAAYHMAPRTAFLSAARHCLRHGGTLAYTDLTVARRPGAALRAAARACGVAPDELAAPEDQAARLARAGFDAIRIESLDAQVLAGFSEFALRQTRLLGADALRLGWRRPLATALLIRALRGSGLGYALLSARKAPP
jgi:SAM-dependent methyltransferase